MTDTVTALRERHVARSARATAPEDLPFALSRVLPRKSGLSVVHHGRAAISKYHRARRAARPQEALSPGEMGRIGRLRYVQFVKKRRSIWNPKTRDYESVEHSYQMDFRQCAIVPHFVTFSTSFDAADKSLLGALYGLASRDDLTRDGKLVVRNVTTHDLALYAGVSVSTFYRHVRRLAAAGALVVRRLGLNRPNVYYLPTSENGSWTYPQGSNRSARARAQKQLHERDIARIDWDAFCRAPSRTPDRAPLPRHVTVQLVPQNRKAPAPTEATPLGAALAAFFEAAGNERPFSVPAPDRSKREQPIYSQGTSKAFTRPTGLQAPDEPPGRST